MSSPIEKAQRWIREERENGLVDVKFYPGSDRDALVEEVIRNFLQMIESRQQGNVTWVTGKPL